MKKKKKKKKREKSIENEILASVAQRNAVWSVLLLYVHFGGISLAHTGCGAKIRNI